MDWHEAECTPQMAGNTVHVRKISTWPFPDAPETVRNTAHVIKTRIWENMPLMVGFPGSEYG